MLFRILPGLVAAGMLIQFVPTGSQHANPAVIAEPAWDSPATRELAKRSCFNCHSNETVWPWYSSIAPVSWLTERDVTEGRGHLDFSEWNQPHDQADEIIQQIQTGRMPPWFYRPMHPEARLTPEEKAKLIEGFRKSLDVAVK